MLSTAQKVIEAMATTTASDILAFVDVIGPPGPREIFSHLSMSLVLCVAFSHLSVSCVCASGSKECVDTQRAIWNRM